MKITIEMSDVMRYDTIGDWQFDELGNLKITIKTCEEKLFIPLAIHEFVEAILCRARGISECQVDKWDMEIYPQICKKTSLFDEAGEHTDCPYYKEHSAATVFERVMVSELGMKWQEYEENLPK